MEQRIQKFHDDSKTVTNPPTAKHMKQMQTLKKFIFKNQDYRFSDKEKNKLFACIETYFSLFDRTQGVETVSAFPLIEDALKVPCFTTKQKTQLLKWYEEILSKQDNDSDKKNHTKSSPTDDDENYDDFDWEAFENEKGED
ncbi:hypothetical protein [Absidia glauca]|uniref:Uncharacterized protein n=1 Tax=Absidia glauca TaxID=4829 RepID=A0A163IX78_ABSGL|nr:hypothetical protein [Absidia glauca]